MSPSLHVVVYHYVRDLPRTPFPRIKGMLTCDFRKQVAALREQYEMAGLDSAIDFLRGSYTPSRDLCLLTFDDGLKEHYTEVTPILADCGIQGVFFVITSCLQERRVAAAHMNHFLMAALDIKFYQSTFLQRLRDLGHPFSNESDTTVAQRIYRYDSPEVASFKYLFNFVLLDAAIRERIVKAMFEENIADEKSFAETLYLNWEEAKQMQAAGMVIGGHSHQHKPLAALPDEELCWDLETCQRLLLEHLRPQSCWPFGYPYGTDNSFGDTTIQQLKRLGFACAFSTNVGSNRPLMDLFSLRRIDCIDVPKGLA